MTPTGKWITPIGKHVEVGSYPINMVTSPDGKFVVVTTIAYREFLAVLDAKTGAVVSTLSFNGPGKKGSKEGLYYGLAFRPGTQDVYFSRGAQDIISKATLSADGKLSPAEDVIQYPKEAGKLLPFHPAGIGFNADGSKLIVANNQTSHQEDYQGSVSIWDVATKTEEARIPTSGFPFGVSVVTKGPQANRIAYVASERDGVLDVIDLANKRLIRKIAVGASPAGMVFNSTQSKLFVSNNGSDTVSVVDITHDQVLDTIMLRPTDLRGLPGAGPTGIQISADDKTLYVTLGDMNAVAAVDVAKATMIGMIPTGWLPTFALPTGDNLLVASAKGTKGQNPNANPVLDRGTYIENIIDGTVSLVKTPSAGDWRKWSATVVKNNRITKGIDSALHPELKNPGVKHVIYIIKENRTYDNVLGDLPKGNGDPKLCLFPRKVTPNLHALAERFVQLDNFHVCAEVSQDGWVWSTAGMINAYGSRNTPYNYSGRGRNYDTEGSNNGVPTDLIDIPDVTRPASGYIWEHCFKNNVSYRNYGFFSQSIDPVDKRNDVLRSAVDNTPTKKLLMGVTDPNFRKYDLTYADSTGYDEYGFDLPRRRKTYGEFKSRSRFEEWKREFDGFVANGNLPAFQMLRLGNNHTSGTASGQPTPQSMVADNDYAVGQLVEAVSKSPYWKDTVICVLEDDAQAGIDHVDAHRSIAFVISPFIKKATLDSRFYNTDSMLRTMEILLGLPPMSQYDAVASPIAVFSDSLVNPEPFTAIKPDRDILCQYNKPSAYRSKDSARISFYSEESEIDEELNEILWKSIKGVNQPMPKLRNGLRFGKAKKD